MSDSLALAGVLIAAAQLAVMIITLLCKRAGLAQRIEEKITEND
jgi:hypothetical protein